MLRFFETNEGQPHIGKHKLGWYLEPGFDYNFGGGHERSIGISVGLLIAFNKR